MPWRRASHRSPGYWGCLLLLCLGSAAVSAGAWADVDPLEGANRKIHAFNDAVDRAILKPLAKGYKRLLPGFLRRGIH